MKIINDNKKQIMKKYLLNIFLSILVLSGTGCSDFLSEFSQDMVVAKTVQDLDELLIGSVYIPSYSKQYGMNSGVCGFFNLLDDDINTVGTSLKGKVGYPFHTFSVQGMFGYYTWQEDVRYNFTKSSSSEDNATWDDLYRRINIVNVILDEIEDLPHEIEKDYADYLRVKGESHFLRAQFFFILANLYGDAYVPTTSAQKLCVPLKLTPYVEYDKEKDTQFERASVEEVYTQIVSDLLNAEKFLSESPQNPKRRLHRASFEAADLLLSRVYLYMQDWTNAELKAKKVMESNNFSLASLAEFSSESAFLTENREEIIFSQGSNNITPPSTTWSIYGRPSDYCVTRELYDMFEDTDVRKNSFFAINALSDSVYLSNKYQRGETKHHVSDALALRMSEAYLNYAEACAMQLGKETEATNVLNLFRNQRIKEHANSTYTNEELIEQIRNERRKELCFEGQRWFDLRRYAVCDRYPYSRDILHTFHEYSDNFQFVSTVHYLLPAGDPAYTFGIPRKILDFDKEPMPDNPREKREPYLLNTESN